jgi:thioredoxin 1
MVVAVLLVGVAALCACNAMAGSAADAAGSFLYSEKPALEKKGKGEAAGEESKPPVVRAVSYADVKTFEQTVLKSDVPVLVDFYANWCGPCKRLAPVLDELARETSQAKFVKVDVDRSPKLAGSFGVRSIPTLIVFKDGKAVAQHVGLASKTSLKRLLNSHGAAL